MLLFMKSRGRVQRIAGFIGIAVALSTPPAAIASNFTFQGQNAGLFPNANPSDIAILMNSVNKPTSTPANLTTSALIQESVISQISTKMYNDIFNGTAAAGYYDLGGGSSISFKRSAGYVTLTVVDPINGSTTLTVLN